MILSLREILNKTSAYLSSAGCDAARLEAELLIGSVLGLDRTQLYVQFDRQVTEAEQAVLRPLLLARAKERTPVAYLTGRKYFFGLDLAVGAGVFIPRPETEELVQAVLTVLAKENPDPARPLRMLDLCTGTGAVALALVKKLAGATAVAVDISPAAVSFARANAEKHGLAGRMEIRTGDLWEPICPLERFEVITANPPYIPRAGIADLPPEIAAHEPLAALDGGEDGLDFYRRILAGIDRHLSASGWLAVEHGDDQAHDIQVMALAAGLRDMATLPDLSGRPRITVFRKPASGARDEKSSTRGWERM